MRRVSREHFYAAIGSLNAHPCIQPGPYPYTSVWKMLDGSGAIVGKSVGIRDERAVTREYYLGDER